MRRTLFPEKTIEQLRRMGDPGLEKALGDGAKAADRREAPKDDATKSYFAAVAKDGLEAALSASAGAGKVRKVVASDTAEAVDELKAYGVKPTLVIARARHLFTYFGDEICASLLLAGLPDTYATAWGSRVLIAHGDLVWALPRRIRQTAMFLMSVFATDETISADDDPNGTAVIERTGAGLRLFHHRLRAQLRQVSSEAIGLHNTEPYKPINQEDLLGTLLTFTVTTFGVLDQLGVHWTDDDREAYLLFWDLVGAALGIGTMSVYDKLSKGKDDVHPKPIRPRTVEHATRLLDQLHDRQWLPVQDTITSGRPFPWSGLVPGRMLTDALVAALTDAMPAPRKMWPAAVMRELAPAVVRSRLGLDSAGLSSYATRWVATRSRYAQSARAATLRMMANDITRHAMQSFLRADGPPFVIPGLDLRELTTSAGVRPNLLDFK